MGAFSAWHIALVSGVAVLFLGGGRISDLMGEAANGIRAFRKGLKDQDQNSDRSC